MLFPKPNRMVYPSCGIGACADTEAVTGTSVPPVFDHDSDFPQILDSLVTIKEGGKLLETID